MNRTWGELPMRRAPRPARVLVVDDDDRVRHILERMLHGHEVVQAASGLQALRLLEHDCQFDLIVSDVTMPGLSGVDLHRWVVDERPALAGRFILVTGGAPADAQTYLDRTTVPCLAKPLELDSLLRSVEKILSMRLP